MSYWLRMIFEDKKWGYWHYPLFSSVCDQYFRYYYTGHFIDRPFDVLKD